MFDYLEIRWNGQFSRRKCRVLIEVCSSIVRDSCLLKCRIMLQFSLVILVSSVYIGFISRCSVVQVRVVMMIFGQVLNQWINWFCSRLWKNVFLVSEIILMFSISYYQKVFGYFGCQFVVLVMIDSSGIMKKVRQKVSVVIFSDISGCFGWCSYQVSRVRVIRVLFQGSQIIWIGGLVLVRFQGNRCRGMKLGRQWMVIRVLVVRFIGYQSRVGSQCLVQVIQMMQSRMMIVVSSVMCLVKKFLSRNRMGRSGIRCLSMQFFV